MAATKNNSDCNCKCHVPITLRDLFWHDPFFSSNWTDFQTVQDQMIQEAKNFWGQFDRKLKRLESGEHQHERFSSSSMTSANTSSATERKADNADEEDFFGKSTWIMPRTFMRLPSLFSEERTKDLISLKDEQTIKTRDDDKVFEVSLDTHNFRPDEIKVNVVDRMLTVEGRHEEKSEDGSKYVSRQFIRKYSLPKECPADQVVSNLSADGVLLVTAPKLNALKDGMERKVPIQMDKK